MTPTFNKLYQKCVSPRCLQEQVDCKKTKQRADYVIDKIVDGETEVENELDIANCLNRSFQTLGSYNGPYVSAPNVSRIEVREKFCFRTVTLKELYDAIYSLDKNKSPDQAFLLLGQSRQQSVQSEPFCSLFLTHALVKKFSRKI